MRRITAPELHHHLQTQQPVLLDVREPAEHAICQLPNSLLIPMGDISSRLQELDEDDEIICICHHGMRSLQVAAYLEHQGFTNVVNLSGGLDAWATQVDTALPRY